MATKKAKKQKPVQWRIEYILFLALETLLRILPVSLCYRIGALMGCLSYYLIKKRRVTVIRNITIAYRNELSGSEVIKLSKRIFSCNGGNLVSALKTATMSSEAIKKCITIEGAEHIEDFAKDNNGFIIILPHMSNWEICTSLNSIAHGGRESGAMYRPLNNPLLDSLVKKRRQNLNTQLFSRKDGMTAPLKIIRKGGVLGILADQRVKKGGIITPFFGRLTPFAPLPEIYKKRTKCGVMSLSIITLAPGKWKVTYTREATKDEAFNSSMVAQSIERLMRQSPKDCFWMQDRWQLNRQPLSLIGKFPIQYPSQPSSTDNKNHIAIYLDEVLPEHLPALTRLASHRFDIHLFILSPSPSVTLPNNSSFKSSPPLSSHTDFLKFFEKLNAQSYVDILFHPQEQFVLPESFYTRTAPIEPESLELSLIEAGLPEQAYQ